MKNRYAVIHKGEVQSNFSDDLAATRQYAERIAKDNPHDEVFVIQVVACVVTEIKLKWDD